MSLENEEPHFPDQPTETNHEMQKKSKISYRREFLLSFSELDTCKKLPSGFDQSIISEFEDAFKDRQRTSGLSAYSFRRNEYGSSPPTRGDVAGYSRPIHGRWEGRSTGRSDRDSDSQSDRDSDSGRHFGNQSWRPLQVPEHDGLLGSGSFPRPAGFTAGISAPKVRSNEPYQLNRTNEPYHPPRPYKAAPHSRRDTDSFNDETFGSSELTSEERAEEERKRRASFELMRKEQHKALQEQKLKPEKNKGEFDFATLVDDSKDERRHRSSEVEEPLIPPAANTDSEKSSFLLQTAAPRPLVPPGFATTVLERNLGPKSLSDTREVEVGSSGLEENIVRAKTKPVLNGTSDNQVEKQSTEQMILSKQQHGSASIDVPVDGMSEKNQNLSPPQGALNKIIGIESQLYNIANTSQPVEVSRNSEVIDLNAEKVMRTKIVGESNQGPPASILEKLFTSAVALNGVGSSNITEHQDSKDDETRSSDTAHSSKFARWFHEERKPSDDFSSGRQNDLLSLIVSGEKGGSSITAGKIRDHRFPSFSSQNSEPADRVMNSDVSPTVGSSEQLSKSNKPEAVSTVLTCEDLEQSILSGISENGLTLLPPVQKWSPPGAGGKPEQLKANVDNNASQHLLSLLQKGTGLKDMEPSYNQETMYFEKLHDTEGATIGTAVRISKNEISENVSDAGKNLTLEILFGTAFMKDLQTVGAPVSVKRAPIGSARVDPMQPHSVPFPVTDNSLIPPAIQIGPNSTSHSSSDLTANRRKQTKSDMIEEQWLGLNNPHIELGSSSSQVGTDLGSKIGAFEGHPDFRLPEEDGLIAPSEPLNVQNFMSSGNQVKSKLFSSPNTQVDIVEKLAAMNSAFKDEGSMGSQEVPPFLRGRGPYDMREPDNPYQNLQRPSQQLHHPQLNHVGPPFHPLDSHPDNINSQMSFLGPKGILRSDLPPNHQFHANILRPPFHHSNIGQSGFDAHIHHPMMQQMRMQGNFPPPHLLQGLSSSPPQHPHPNLGATLPAQPVSQAFMQELNPMQGFPFGPQKPNFGGHGMPLPAPDAAGGSNHHPEALQRLIEMELRSNPKQIHQFPASGHTQGTHGHELDMGCEFGLRCMQSGGGGGGGPGRGVGPAGRAGSTSSAASPSSSSSAVSTPQLGFDSVQHQQHQQQQQQQQQQLGSRQPLHQQQFLRKPEGNEALLAYQAAGLQGVLGGGGSSQMPQQSRKFIDLAQQHGSQDGQSRSQGVDQQAVNPVHQAYLQYAFQAAQQKSGLTMQPQQQAKMGLLGPPSGKDQDMRLGNMKMQEVMSNQAPSQALASSSKNLTEHFIRGEKQVGQGQPSVSDQRSDSKPSAQPSGMGQFMPGNMLRPMLAPQSQPSGQTMPNNQIALVNQLQAFALEHNIDLSQPGNANLMSQLIPLLQSRISAQQKANESNIGAQSSPVPVSKQQVTSPPVAIESSPRANTSSDVSGQSSSAKAKQTVAANPFGSGSNSSIFNNSNGPMQQFSVHGRENQMPPRQSNPIGNGMTSTYPTVSSANTSQGVDHSFHVKNSQNNPETLQMQYHRQLSGSSPQAVVPNDGVSGNKSQSQGGLATQMGQQRHGFTKQQLHVLKAQILAFRRLKKGEGTLPQELLRAIAPPPLEMQPQQQLLPGGGNIHDKSSGKTLEDHVRHMESNEKDSQAVASMNAQNGAKEEAFAGEEKAIVSTVHVQGALAVVKEPTPLVSSGKEEQHSTLSSVKSDHEVERGIQKASARSEIKVDRGKSVASQVTQVAVSDVMQVKKPAQASTVPLPKDVSSARKYHGPLFDFPFFTRKHDSLGSGVMVNNNNNNNNNLTLAYDVKDLVFEEGVEVLNKKRTENIKKIGGLLAVNLERKRIRPDLVLRLQIEEKKLRLSDLQARLRDEIDQHQQEIMAMPDRPYRKFVRLCERQRMELSRQVQASQKAMREKQLKSIFQWRKKLLEAHWAIRDARTARNRGVAKYHERMLREFSKRKDDHRNKRMEALKNNDVERYREMLLEQQTSIPGDAAERYAVLSSFLSQTEEYLHKLGSKITAAKNQQEVEEAANAAAAAARLQGLSEEEVRTAAACAGEEVMIRNRFIEMNAPRDSSSVNKYYSLAHAVNERVIRQPSMLRTGNLRDYQLVGLQWMLSLYNNKLNGILADEMGLGKTVQVMALIAYLMEFKGNYGPHLIIVPNAVLVNWKSELHTWLPSVSCIYYVGGKDQRAKLFSQEVCALKFNVLVTTYEFIMYDRSKLSKIDWKYIIIDEAQRMKDRESVLARDLDRYRCQRRLLLTGTPLQNDLKELWSLLNLLLPEVFDNRKAFHDWFSKPFQREAPTPNAEDDWLETEKKVIIIHRLHQILEPFMLRRRVEDVEGALPSKISIVLRCRMSAIQSAVYDWIKSTGTIRVDPEEEKLRIQKNPQYQPKVYKTLNNRCMELRKTCNHPLLNYPFFNDFSKDFLVRSCGKLWILDRILVKLQKTGHRVLLFSTMTKLLDILEEYLQWRHLVFRRIDGTTSLEDRESAIVDFNRPGSDCFIFLLSIRAAGRGLNLQSADTVVIYDPDPNPKNEEQAVARAHRIGQKREVKVIYLEAVVDKMASHQKEDELRSGGTVDSEDDLAGKDRYIGSIESLIRNNIQQYKIDMADEVINAGRFDQRTTHEERRMTLETLLHDEERYQETLHDVPSLQEVNRMIARSKEEVELFDQMDEELDWIEEMTRYNQLPKWLRTSTNEVNAVIASLSKRPSKTTLLGGNAGLESTEMGSGSSPKTERKRGRPKKNHPSYKELDDDNGEYFEASSDENEEEGEVEELEDDEYSGAVEATPIIKEQVEEDVLECDGGYEYPKDSERVRNNHILEEAGSSGSSSDSRRLMQTVSPVSSQKFGSLSALDGRPGSASKRMQDDVEEGEIVVSGDSHVDHLDHQQSGSSNHDRDEGEDEQVLQPKIKRKRSLRVRPRHTIERPEEKSGSETPSLQRGDSSLLPFHVDHKSQAQSRADSEIKTYGEPHAVKHDQSDSSSKTRRILPRRGSNMSKVHVSPKSGRSNGMSDPAEDAAEPHRENWDGKVGNTSGTSVYGTKMSEIVQRKCKNVISKFQRRIDKEGPQIVPLLTDLWKRIENSSYASGSGNNLLDLRKIDQRIERLEYAGVMELVSDVQSMLKNGMQFYGFNYEVRTEARKVHDLFFDILKIAFAETDFREARSALSFTSPVLTSNAPSPRAATVGLSKRHKLINEVEPDSTPQQKPQQRAPIFNGEDTRVRSHILQKESRLGSGSGNSRDHYHQDDSPPLAHPGDLVICKKKRKDREKSVVKTRTGSAGPVSPPSVGRSIRSPGPNSVPKQNPHSQGWANQPGQPTNKGGGSVGWANPVKRLRTDSGKRRPSHL